jgi:hypothetical protein
LLLEQYWVVFFNLSIDKKNKLLFSHSETVAMNLMMEVVVVLLLVMAPPLWLLGLRKAAV